MKLIRYILVVFLASICITLADFQQNPSNTLGSSNFGDDEYNFSYNSEHGMHILQGALVNGIWQVRGSITWLGDLGKTYKTSFIVGPQGAKSAVTEEVVGGFGTQNEINIGGSGFSKPTSGFGGNTRAPFSGSTVAPSYAGNNRPYFGGSTESPFSGSTVAPPYAGNNRPSFGGSTETPFSGSTVAPPYAGNNRPSFGGSTETPFSGSTVAPPYVGNSGGSFGGSTGAPIGGNNAPPFGGSSGSSFSGNSGGTNGFSSGFPSTTANFFGK